MEFYNVSSYDMLILSEINLRAGLQKGWSTEGLTLDKSSSNEFSITCLTTHMTSFGILSNTGDAQGVRKIYMYM